MTLLEVMVALAILSFAVIAMMGNIATLDRAHRAAKETAVAQQLAQVLAERFQGATWHTLGQGAEHWSYHRRQRAGAGNPPLSETDATTVAGVRVNNLEGLGLLTAPSGLRDLKVYVEYYAMGLCQDAGGAWQIAAGPAFRARLADPTWWLPETALDLRDVADAVVIRLRVTWSDRDGGARRHELVFARRK